MMPDEKLLLIDSDTGSALEVLQALRAWGHTVLHASASVQGMECYASQRPPIVLINADMPGGSAVIGDIRAMDPDVVLIVLTAAEHLPQVMRNFQHSAQEFLSRPLDTVALSIALQRTRRVLDLLREVRLNCTSKRTRRTCANVAREVDTERFLTVRQMIEKMSAFIAQVATGVQGGVKYFNELPYFVAVHSADGRVLAANATSLKYLGNRLYGNSWEIYAGKRKSRENCPVGRTVRSGNVETTKALVRYAKGAKVPVLVHTAPIYDNDGEVVLVLEVFAGTQEIDQLAEKVRTTQQRYEQLFDAVPSQIVVLDRRFTITATNKKFKTLFGDQVGRHFFETFRPAEFPPHRDPISMTMSDGEPRSGEMIFTGPDHQLYTMLVQTTPILTPTGKMVQVSAIFTDVTELRQIKDHLATLGLMLSTVCHDMKGCLTGLDAGLYLVDKGLYRNEDGRIEEGLEVMRLMADRIRKMVFDVLYSTKERELELEAIEVITFTGELVAGFETRMRGADIEFCCQFNCAGQMQVDVGLLRSAMNNILENALEACLENKARRDHRVDVMVRCEDEQVIFEISDNGIGIAPDALKTIFNVFHSSKGREGTGLGLYITDKVVRRHGGTIRVDSIPYEKTTFTIQVPRRMSEAATAGNAA
jgi:PAS domain S-box-containing protein